jgi:hypothetical protein
MNQEETLTGKESVEGERWPVVWLKREPDADLPYGGWHLSRPDPLGAEPYDEALPYYPASHPVAEVEGRLNCDCGILDGPHWKTHCTTVLAAKEKLKELREFLLEAASRSRAVWQEVEGLTEYERTFEKARVLTLEELSRRLAAQEKTEEGR